MFKDESHDNIRFWSTSGGKTPAQEYLDRVEREDPVAYAKLNAHIYKLSENKGMAIDGSIIKKLHIEAIPYSLPRIKCKRYRVYTMLTPRFLFLLLGENKHSNQLPKKTERLIISRAKNIIQNYNEL